MEYRVVYDNDPKSMGIIEASSSRDAAIIFFIKRVPKSHCSVVVTAQDGSHTRFPTNELALELSPAFEVLPNQTGLPSASALAAPTMQRVTVADIDMKFTSMVSFMVKWAFASIPAFIIIFLVLLFVLMFFGGLSALFLHR